MKILVRVLRFHLPNDPGLAILRRRFALNTRTGLMISARLRILYHLGKGCLVFLSHHLLPFLCFVFRICLCQLLCVSRAWKFLAPGTTSCLCMFFWWVQVCILNRVIDLVINLPRQHVDRTLILFYVYRSWQYITRQGFLRCARSLYRSIYDLPEHSPGSISWQSHVCKKKHWA